MDVFNKINSITSYDFQLERQILCTTKANAANVTNPFFK